MTLDSFLRGLHSERKLDFSGILFTSVRQGRLLLSNMKIASEMFRISVNKIAAI